MMISLRIVKYLFPWRIYTTTVLKGLNIILQEFVEYKYTIVEELRKVKLEYSSKYSEG